MTFDDPLTSLRGVGPRRAADFERAGLRTIADLLARFPLRYEDRAHFRDVTSLVPGESVAVCGTVESAALKLTRRRGFKLVDAVIRTDTGPVRAVWLNQPFMLDVVRRGTRLVLFGPIEHRPPSGVQLTNPDYEPCDETQDATPVHTGRIVPVYERCGAVTSRVQRTLVQEALHALGEDLPETLPAWLVERCGLPPRKQALAEVHFPAPETSLAQLVACRTPAHVRLILDEFVHFQLGLLLRRRANREAHKSLVCIVNDRVRAAARAVLPFQLTEGQRAALKAIVADMTAPYPMHRLLQGDVGSGKTVVALLAAVVAIENGLQVAFMAPTEILAEQHALTIRRLFERTPYRTAILTGAMPAAERRDVLEGLASGRVHLVVGTHALVQDRVTFERLGFVIVDEQHRFGVMQRAVLRRKGWNPDVLVMTATPIPRTLALTTYGDLDVSVMPDMPPGRLPVRTVALTQAQRDEAYEVVRRAVAEGRQAYVVFPLIEDSAKIDVRAATAMADHLAVEVLPEARLGLLHGRLNAEDKDRIMRAFAGGEIDVLVSTTVIEVGIDVPNATVMVIEHADRFGLAQLHQLRGRIGRGPHPSTCVLVTESPRGDAGEARIAALVETTDGFEIAERDLELRGPGDVFGTRQSGAPTLRSGDLLRDRDLMEDARRYAQEALERPGIEAIAEGVRRTWGTRFGLAEVG